MNPLVGGLPTTVSIGGTEYPINTSHRVGLRFEALILSDHDDRTKFDGALRLYYPTVPPDPIAAIERIGWFHRLGKPIAEGESTRAYDFAHDFDLIDASFMRDYGIDLYATDLHWWRFRALLFGLSDDTPFMKAVGYRTVRLPAKMDAQQREFYQRMKRIYALPGNEQPRMTIAEVYRAKFGDVVD